MGELRYEIYFFNRLQWGYPWDPLPADHFKRLHGSILNSKWEKILLF
jgi:hypothetical protein